MTLNIMLVATSKNERVAKYHRCGPTHRRLQKLFLSRKLLEFIHSLGYTGLLPLNRSGHLFALNSVEPYLERPKVRSSMKMTATHINTTFRRIDIVLWDPMTTANVIRVLRNLKVVDIVCVVSRVQQMTTNAYHLQEAHELNENITN